MAAATPKIVHTAEKVVQRLVSECRKGGALYAQNPKDTAQVSRTAKWLLNAITRLRREADANGEEGALK
jgi:hypothetical protein